MTDLVDRLCHIDSSQDSWEICHEAAKEIKRLRRIAGDRLYMMEAYKWMLGPNGLKVVDGWERKGVLRQHTYWGPDAHKQTGEERAATLLGIELALGTEVDLDAIYPQPTEGKLT